MDYCAQPAEADSDYCGPHRHGVYREHDESAASTLTVGGVTPPLSLWIDGLTVSTNADRLRVILYVWKPNV